MCTWGDWLLTPARVAIHRSTATAVLADPHFGYAEARRLGGEAVPVRGLESALAPLEAVVAAHAIHRLVIAGDLFEAGYNPDVAAGFLSWLNERGVELVAVVPGNHDRGLDKAEGNFSLCADGVSLGSWRVVHGDRELPPGPVVQGHWHPCLRWGKELVAPCYLAREDRLVLPAFSTEAAGVNVMGRRDWRDYRCFVIAEDRVLDFGDVAGLKNRLPSLSRVSPKRG
jgi:metallophosphoesterase superfamily enzyme